jgi:predicted PurR-regulated permease PerM
MAVADHHDARGSAPIERVVAFRPRTLLLAWGSLIGLAAALWLVWTARHVLTWIVVALFLALALDPAVQWFQRRGVRRRGAAAGLVYVATLVVVGAVLAILLPPLISQVQDFANALPGYVHDLTHGRGSLGFLERRYHVVERTREAVQSGGASSIAGSANTVLSFTQSIVSGVVGGITIAFLTFFMLLDGPAWVERGYAMMRPDREPRWRRLGSEVYRVVSGYVTGNLLISLIAGTGASLVLLILGVPFPLALGLVVFILDLIPLVGATLAAVILALAALSHSVTAAIVVVAYFVVYQQVENHLLQPLVYGRTVQLSSLAALIAVLIGGELGGVLGALGGIPVAGVIRAVMDDWFMQRQADRRAAAADGVLGVGAPAVAARAPEP